MHLPKLNPARDRSLLLLAPPGAPLEPFSGSITSSPSLHGELLADMQRLRGRVYREDGAIQEADLTACGRHVSPLDRHGWHLLTLGKRGNVMGCTRFLRHANTVEVHELGVSRAPLAHSDVWGPGFRACIDLELKSARGAGFSYVEIGGWALDAAIRGTTEALKCVLATFALAQIQGGAIGVSTATERNGSAAILRRLGGKPLEWQGRAIPPYWDDNYGCGMEVLRFDSRSPSPRYAPLIRDLQAAMRRVPVICAEELSSWAKAARAFAPGSAFVPAPAAFPVGV